MNITLNITFTPDMEQAVADAARQRGLTPEDLVLQAVQEKVGTARPALREPRDDWERLLASLPVDAGVSLTDEQCSSENFYD